MNPRELQSYIYEHIPIVAANGFEIADTSGGVVSVRGRYGQHINHRASVFGGSIGTALTLASWSQARLLLEERGLVDTAVIVVQRHAVEFLKPVVSDFTARGLALTGDRVERFLDMLRRHHRAKIELEAELIDDIQQLCATAVGTFAVFIG